MAVKTTRSSVIWTLPPRRRLRTALFAVAVVMSLLPNVSDAVDGGGGDGDLQFFCDKAVRHKYCGDGGSEGAEDREWVHSYHVSVTGVAFFACTNKELSAVGDHP